MPMESARKAPSTKGAPGTYDRHITPVISNPRTRGKDGVPEKFFEVIKGTPATLSTPMGTAIEHLGQPLEGEGE